MFIQKMVATIIISICILIANPAFARTIKVDQSGDGDCLNIQTGLDIAEPDDRIVVGPGIYEESIVINKNILLNGSGPNYTTIKGASNGITVNENIICSIVGFTVTSGDSGIFLNRNSRTTIKNNCIISNGSHGVYMTANNGGSSGSLETLIINNTIAYNSRSGIASNNYYQSHPECNIINNIISFNGEYGIALYGADKNIFYNNVYSNISANYIGCEKGTGDNSVNPSFIDSPGGDFALSSSSLCINSGRPGSADADPDGTRNDMGAYAGPDAVAFWPYIENGPVVTEMSINPGSVPKGSTITITAEGRVQ